MTSYSSKSTGEEIAADCHDQIAGKTIFVTGTTPGGLGASFALTIAKQAPSCIILATRSLAKAEQTARDIAAVSSAIRTHCVEVDLEDLDSVRKAADKVNALDETIDVIVNNAGIMGNKFATNKAGIERHFAANHLGHFLLTNLLLPKMLEAKKPIRVVNVTSNGFRFSPVRVEDLNFGEGQSYDRWEAYGQSKTANMLFSVSLAKKLGNRGLVSVSLHPGVIIGTGLAQHIPMEEFAELGVLDHKMGYRSYWENPPQMKQHPEGVATHVLAAFHPSLDAPESNGRYLVDSQVVPPENVQSWARDPVDAEKLWALSEELVSQKFVY